MNTFDKFQNTKPRLTIGQSVRVIGEFEADWRGEECIVSAIGWNGQSNGWVIEIMTIDEINSGCGSTDGWSEAELVPVGEGAG